MLQMKKIDLDALRKAVAYGWGSSRMRGVPPIHLRRDRLRMARTRCVTSRNMRLMRFPAIAAALMLVLVNSGCAWRAKHHQAPLPAQSQVRPLDTKALYTPNLGAALKAVDHHDYTTAARDFRALAAQGNAIAQMMLGEMYHEGKGVPQDDVQAMAWIRNAAIQGLPEAQRKLGMLYFNGQGTARDYKQAAAWYRNAAAKGDADAQRELGSMYFNGRGMSRDLPQAVTMYRKAAAQADPGAQVALGVMYHFGQGVPKDDAQALVWFHRGAAQGYADAQYYVGLMYQGGQGVPHDDAQAAAWYRKAVQDDALAQSALGMLYASGRGVSKDAVVACALFTVAMASTSPVRDKVAGDRASLTHTMTPAQIDAATSLASQMQSLGVSEALDAHSTR